MAQHSVLRDLAQDRTARLILAAVQYARDVNDRMRVVVDNTVSTATTAAYFNSSTSGIITPRMWYEAAAVLTMDQREIQRQQSLINGEIARQKWVYS